MSTNNKVALQFRDMRSLWIFAQQLTCKVLKIIPAEKLLFCECVEDEIELALSVYGAKILEVDLSQAELM